MDLSTRLHEELELRSAKDLYMRSYIYLVMRLREDPTLNSFVKILKKSSNKISKIKLTEKKNQDL
jgi:hypothetical protein